MLKKIKKEVRILGIDDAPFDKKHDKEVLVVATVFRGGSYLDGLLSCRVHVDGDDATAKLISLIKKTKHLEQLQCIMIDGIALGGFNVIDINQLSKKTRLPVLVVIRRMPNIEKIEKALRKIKAARKIKLLKKAGKIHSVRVKNKHVYMQAAGINYDLAAKIVKLTAVHSLIPEPIRVAHLIASGIVLGESRGRA